MALQLNLLDKSYAGHLTAFFSCAKVLTTLQMWGYFNLQPGSETAWGKINDSGFLTSTGWNRPMFPWNRGRKRAGQRRGALRKYLPELVLEAKEQFWGSPTRHPAAQPSPMCRNDSAAAKPASPGLFLGGKQALFAHGAYWGAIISRVSLLSKQVSKSRWKTINHYQAAFSDHKQLQLNALFGD